LHALVEVDFASGRSLVQGEGKQHLDEASRTPRHVTSDVHPQWRSVKGFDGHATEWISRYEAMKLVLQGVLHFVDKHG
jgi:hypothetical protein